MVEAGVDAREIEVSVIGNDSPRASLPGEIVPDREFYDYDSKYSATSRTELKIPAPLTDAERAAVQDLGVRVFRAVDAAGFARVDFFLERKTGRLLVNEINTIPGFTSISMFPKLWEASGLGYVALLTELVELGIARHRERAALRTQLAR
jgi:D-alanine-D-alanine ligase